jgi:biotin carboxyl carrier protein
MKTVLVNQNPCALPEADPKSWFRLDDHTLVNETENGLIKAYHARTAKGVWVFVNGASYFVEEKNKSTQAQATGSTQANGTVLSPMPGKVFKLFVKMGDVVKAGQDLLIIEAMKMEHNLTAPFTGTVISCPIKQGDSVEFSQELVVITPASSV